MENTTGFDKCKRLIEGIELERFKGEGDTDTRYASKVVHINGGLVNTLVTSNLTVGPDGYLPQHNRAIPCETIIRLSRGRKLAIIDVDDTLRSTKPYRHLLPSGADLFKNSVDPVKAYMPFAEACRNATPLADLAASIKDMVFNEDYRPIFLTSTPATMQTVTPTMKLLHELGMFTEGTYRRAPDEPLVAFRNSRCNLDQVDYKRTFITVNGLNRENLSVFIDDSGIQCKMAIDLGLKVFKADPETQTLNEFK